MEGMKHLMSSSEVIASVIGGGLFLLMFGLLMFVFRLHRKSRAESAQSMISVEENARQIRERLASAETELARLHNIVGELEEQARLVAGAPAKSWSNINRRTQAVRMLKNGGSSDSIATQLAISPGEVELIRRVQRLTEEKSSISAISS